MNHRSIPSKGHRFGKRGCFSKRGGFGFVFIRCFFIVLVIVGLGAGVVFYYIQSLFDKEGPLEEAQILLIQPGMGIRSIATLLAEKNMISNEKIFIYRIYWEQKAKELKAGEYEIPAHASMRQIMDILILGRSIEHSFSVPEGLTVAQIFDRLQQETLFSGSLPEILPSEGWLMTDTIKFTRGTARTEIVQRLKQEQRRLVQELWDKRDPDLPLKDMNEFVILASIVEKETGVASERPLIASVFYNRLKKNMRLQSDPTVIYGIFGSSGKPAERPIYRSDLERLTPFNTYKIDGLPPSPIANPGRHSLQAVAHPAQTDALYFVADGTGGHAFAKTLQEHNKNVTHWRRLEKERKISTVDDQQGL